jgi:signal transduction histidine kinase
MDEAALHPTGTAPVNAAWLPDPARLAALAEFAAGAGHEINNPLATIIGRAQQLLRDEADPQRRQSLATIAAQAYRIRDMIGDVMLFARPPQPERQSFDAVAACRQVVDRLAEPLAQSQCRAVVNGPETLQLAADPTQFAVVVSELVRNALTALQPAGGEIRLDLAATESGISVAVTDRGRGFSELERQHAFDPFFSGRQAGRGLGFGLCKVARILDQHGGRVAITSPPGGPTTVTTFWP